MTDYDSNQHPMRMECAYEFREIGELFAKMEDLPKRVEELTSAVTELRVAVAGELSALKTKSGIWGALGGLIPVVIALAWLVARSG